MTSSFASFAQTKRFVLIALTAFAVLLLCAPQAKAQLLRDAEIEQWLKDYTDPLFEAAGLPAGSVGVHLLGDPTLNAFVTNGSNMYIHTGLITAASTPNEVQGVLAHETGHIAGGHLARGADAIANASRPIMLSMVLGAAAIMAGAPDAGMAAFALGQTIGQANYLTYNRGQEASADQAAMTYLTQIGASGDGLVSFFKILRNQQLISYRAPNPYLQSHPLPTARIDALEQRVHESNFAGKPDSPEAIERFKMIQAKINGFMNDSQVTQRQYPLSDQSEPAHYARAVAMYRASNLDSALKEINYLIDKHPDNPFFYELKGQMLFEHGKIMDSVEPHRISTELGPQYALLKINYGRALVALEDPMKLDEAISTLNIALDMDPENAFGWTELARAYSQARNDTMASLAQAEAYFAIGNQPEAHRFATRALANLPEQTPEWRQASDIINASETSARRARSRPGRPN